MLFPSEEFLFLFLPVVLIVYYALLRRTKQLKNIFLFLVSIYFYAAGGNQYVILILFVIAANWTFGLLVDKYREKERLVKWILAFSVIVNIGVLGIYKYTGFVIHNINKVFSTKITDPGIVLPIGISFFTFQAMSYTVDVYRKRGKVQKNPLNVGLYIALFPQLIAGPIVRYETIAEQIEHRVENLEDFVHGVCRFIVGLGKKVLLANSMGMIADTLFAQIFAGQYHASFLGAWIGGITYTLQLFFDFSGYSDMAIGLGKMFGFHFEENFNYPYIAKSFSDFWRRWHISLQTWFRDYVYFPLGGSRVKTKTRLIGNLFIVWLLTGIWHGANWTYIGWGLLNFVVITFEKMSGVSPKLENAKGIKAVFSHFYTMFFWVVGCSLFRADSISDARIFIGAMFGIGAKGFLDTGVVSMLTKYLLYVVAALIACIPLFKKVDEKYKGKVWWDICYIVFILAVLFLSIMNIINSSYNPFIYFNF